MKITEIFMWVVAVLFLGAFCWGADKVIANDQIYRSEFTAVRSEMVVRDEQILDKIMGRFDKLQTENNFAHQEILKVLHTK